MSGSISLDNISSLSQMRTSESFSDLNAEMSGTTGSANKQRSSQRMPVLNNLNGNNGGLTSVSDDNKPFGLGKKTF